jgi:tetratricopeptide (TPR) repeat protein
MAVAVAVVVFVAGTARANVEPSPAERESAARGLEAQYQATLIRERRLADDREARLIADAEARMRRVRADVDAARGDNERLRGELQVARADYAKLVAEVAGRDKSIQAELSAYRAETQNAVARASPEKLAALQRFADGDRVGAWPVLEELTQASVRARLAAAGAAAAVEMRELAHLRRIMLERGEATTEDALRLFEQAAALDPTNFEAHLYRARLAQFLGDKRRALSAIEQAAATARDIAQMASAAAQAGNLHLEMGNPAAARTHFEKAAAGFLKLYQDSKSYIWARDLANVMDGLSMVQRDSGDLPTALKTQMASIGVSRKLVEAFPNSLDMRVRLATGLERAVNILLRQQNYAAALPLAQECLGIWRRATEIVPASVDFKRSLALTHDSLGTIYLEQDDMVRARAEYELQYGILVHLASLDPTSGLTQVHLARSHHNLGRVATITDDHATAIRHLRQAIAMKTKMAAADPRVAREVAGLTAMLAQNPGSGVSWQQVVALYESLQARGGFGAGDAERLAKYRRYAAGDFR